MKMQKFLWKYKKTPITIKYGNRRNTKIFRNIKFNLNRLSNFTQLSGYVLVFINSVNFHISVISLFLHFVVFFYFHMSMIPFLR